MECGLGSNLEEYIQRSHDKKIEILTLSELNVYVLTSPPQTAAFLLLLLITLKHQMGGAISHVPSAPVMMKKL
ncbi:hypothetical protein Bca4012_020181 [Brassica carinata]